MRIFSLFSMAMVSMILTACAGPPTLYQWGPYEGQLYSHFKSESPQAQIDVMEKHAKIVQEAGQSLPPGYMAHLAVLYGRVGRDADQMAALQKEKDRETLQNPWLPIHKFELELRARSRT